MQTTAQIRQSFIDFFKRQGHSIVASASLVPASDPTLLFTNAGMVPFKDYFLNPEQSPYRRAVSCQRCLRVGGKHNDLENVGYTARHHTFFEMLGNFSFADYFKEEAMQFAWQFITQELKLPIDRLYVTVYQDDEEAFKLWHKNLGVAKNRIVRRGEKDNFWSMGETGPCGPCSELLFDQGPNVGCGRPSCDVNCDCDRHLEIWNLVFMQFNRDSQGSLSPLPKPCIDTGMGLERISAIVQGVPSNYLSDAFRNLIMRTSILLQAPYHHGKEATDASLHVIADHIRAIVFLIADGVQPANDGRGYVLRRILRRAMRHGRNLGSSRPFLFEVADAVIHDMQAAYPLLKKNPTQIKQTIREEEEQFLLTLERGMKYLNEELLPLKKQGMKLFPGETAFYLYETYGFPVDLTEDILRGEGFQLQRETFDTAANAHREKARGTWKRSGSQAKASLEGLDHFIRENRLAPTPFTGYQKRQEQARLEWIIDATGKALPQTEHAGDYTLIFSHTPFYAQSGGQVGDQGFIRGDDLQATVLDTLKMQKVFLHQVQLSRGSLIVGSDYTLQVNENRRALITRNHTLTHLLHASLREVLGDHIRQAGSYLDEQRLTFDFFHPQPITPEQLQAIIKSTHQKIWGNFPVKTDEMAYTEAIRLGALAFFEEKYGDQVRVVTVGDFSMELCGGTHVPQTGEIGLCQIIGEHSVAAKTRRIEAISGAFALDRLEQEMARLEHLASTLKTTPKDLEKRLSDLIAENKELKGKLNQSDSQSFNQLIEQSIHNKIPLPGGRGAFVPLILPNADAQTLRSNADKIMDKIQSGVTVSASVNQGPVTVVIKVSKDLTNTFQAPVIGQQIAELFHGKGGGRADMAQFGGNTDAPQELIKKISNWFKQTN